MGDFDIKYDENCLSLNIWTPGKKGDDKPVIVKYSKKSDKDKEPSNNKKSWVFYFMFYFYTVFYL